jgi:peptide chain release factor 1
MHDSMTKKLDMLIDRQAEIQNLLIQPETSNDINLLTELNKEFADINPIAELYSEYKDLMQLIEEAKQIIEMGDEDLMALAEEDLKNNQDRPAALEKQLKIMLLPKDSADDGSAYLEIRAGAGGDEAGIFAGDLFRMYSRMSEREHWTIEVLNLRPAEQGGYK